VHPIDKSSPTPDSSQGHPLNEGDILLGIIFTRKLSPSRRGNVSGVDKGEVDESPVVHPIDKSSPTPDSSQGHPLNEGESYLRAQFPVHCSLFSALNQLALLAVSCNMLTNFHSRRSALPSSLHKKCYISNL